MIYKKDANFPYPILTNTTSAYMDPKFLLDVNLEEFSDFYRFKIEYFIGSQFIKYLIAVGRATVILIIQSQDTTFTKLATNQTFVDIKKSRIHLNEGKTSIQLQIQTNDEISFKDNGDLTIFYVPFKENIVVDRNKLLGFSNVVVFVKSETTSEVLFKKNIDESLTSDIKIELGADAIIIHYKKEEYQFNGLRNSRDFNTPYLYAGLQKALHRFVLNYHQHKEDEFVEIDEIDIDTIKSELDLKLYNLLIKNSILEVSFDNIDEVISLISKNMIGRYTTAVKELEYNEN